VKKGHGSERRSGSRYALLYCCFGGLHEGGGRRTGKVVRGVQERNLKIEAFEEWAVPQNRGRKLITYRMIPGKIRCEEGGEFKKRKVWGGLAGEKSS